MAILNIFTTIFGSMWSASIFLAVSVVIAAVYYGYMQMDITPDLSHIPLLNAHLSAAERKRRFEQDGKAYVLEGYNQYNKHGKVFKIDTSEGTKVFLGLQQMDEIRSKPDTVVDNLQPAFHAVQEKYTHIGAPDDVVVRVIKTDLSTKLGQLGDVLSEQIDTNILEDFPAANDWTTVRVYQPFLHIVAAVSTRIFLGPELTRNEEWLKIMIQYTGALFQSAGDIKRYPAWKRPFVYWTLPSYKKLRETEKIAESLVGPVITARREAMGKPGYEPPNDMTTWMINGRIKAGFMDNDMKYMAHAQLQLSMAAIHTTSMALTNMIYDLVANPQYQDIIRDELQTELKANNGSFEGLMQKLQKADSFMKESQRHNPVGIAGSARFVKQSFTLADGTFIPKNTMVIGNNYAITHDPDVLKSESDPNVFDGLRYYNMRNQLIKTDADSNAVAGKHQFVSISQSSLMFGYGRHACPGRFFAGNEIKLILVKFLQRYEVKFEGKERYRSKPWETANGIDPTQPVLIRRIQKGE